MTISVRLRVLRMCHWGTFSVPRPRMRRFLLFATKILRSTKSSEMLPLKFKLASTNLLATVAANFSKKHPQEPTTLTRRNLPSVLWITSLSQPGTSPGRLGVPYLVALLPRTRSAVPSLLLCI
ncbi:hypothetical protein LB505_007996 [Fusarium chuoi]|nr:hypothetical protein LB505_007996 [Fusarium chuoi]